MIPIIYIAIISQRRRIVKHDSDASFIYMRCFCPSVTALPAAYRHSPPGLRFRAFSRVFSSTKSGKYHLLSDCVPSLPIPIILCLPPPNTALFGVHHPWSKSHLPILFISLHFVNIFLSLRLPEFIVMLHKFATQFSTHQQVAQIFLFSLIFCDFLPFSGFTFSFSQESAAQFGKLSRNTKKLDF